MDPITVLQNRIEQLEAKLGLNPMTPAPGDPQQLQQGDSVTANLLNTAQAISNATAGHEKLAQAMNRASELNNYTDPNAIENMHQNQMHMQEVVDAEQALRHHCHCMHHCQKAEPVLESEPIQQVPQMQETVDNMQVAAAEVKQQAEEVTQGIQKLAETCGDAASVAAENLANIAHKVDEVDQKMFPKRRNGLD